MSASQPCNALAAAEHLDLGAQDLPHRARSGESGSGVGDPTDDAGRATLIGRRSGCAGA